MKEKRKENLFRRILRRKKIIAILLILVVAVVLVLKFVVFKKGNFETAKIERGSVSEELVLSGEIKADQDADISFQSSGKIAWVGVKVGDKVKKGQALAQLDAKSLDADLQIARSTLRAAEATVDKIHDDVKNHSSDESFTQRDTRTTAEAAKDKAYDAVRKAEDNIKNATLYSPFEGVVTYVANPFSGVNVIYGTKQFEIVNLGTIYFDVAADQTEVTQLKIGQEVNMVMDSFQGKEFKGKVDYISLAPKEGEAGAVYDVKVKLTDSNLGENVFRIGMTGDANFIISQKDNVLYAPQKFINSDGGGKFVYLGKGNNKVYIETGIEGEDRTEILKEVGGADKIKEGVVIYQ